jgi:protein arginine kinase activator
MTCDRCNQPASVYFTQIVGDNIKKVNLCHDCAQSQKVTDPTGFALADLLENIGSQGKLPRPKRSPGPTCPCCGFSAADFKKTGRLGCPECYGVFRESLLTILPGMHRGVAHLGKVPTHPAPPSEGGNGLLGDLQDRLDRAVADEDFEEAARVRDLMRRVGQPGPQEP